MNALEFALYGAMACLAGTWLLCAFLDACLEAVDENDI